MKHISLIGFFFTVIFLMAFSYHKANYPKQKKVSPFTIKEMATGDTAIKETDFLFDYPDDIKENAKPDFVKKIKKGKILYNINCSKCHNMSVKDESVIPDFSLPQLMDYEMRIQYPAHQEELRETNVTVEELDLIVDFLRYKKKSGVDWKS